MTSANPLFGRCRRSVPAGRPVLRGGDGHRPLGRGGRHPRRCRRARRLTDLKVTPMTDADGAKRSLEKWRRRFQGRPCAKVRRSSASSRSPRIEIYPSSRLPEARSPGADDLPFSVEELRSNGASRRSRSRRRTARFAARPVVAPSAASTRRTIFLRGYWKGPMKGAFTVVRADPYSVTDAAFLPDGDLLLLERRFQFRLRSRMRVRRIAAGKIRPGGRGRRRCHARSGHELSDRQYGGARRHLAA